jgi:exosome complex RNA-binding protein Rrp42 (RNase PH superfamily)
MVGVGAEPTKPSEIEGGKGRIVVGVDIAAVCSPAAAAYERDKAALVELLQRAASDGLVDLERLCAVDGVAVWSLYCDVCVLEHDGNLADASLLALMIALSRVRLPSVRLEKAAEGEGEGGEASGGGEGGPRLVVVEEESLRLDLHRPLYPISFGSLASHLILDPNASEESLTSATITLLLDGEGKMRSLHQPGGAPLPPDTLDACLQAARKRLPHLKAIVHAEPSGETAAGGQALFRGVRIENQMRSQAAKGDRV